MLLSYIINKFKNNKYTDTYCCISNNEVLEIRKNYKIVNINLAEDKPFENLVFDSESNEKNIVSEMLNYYLYHKDKEIYKKTDYLCNKKEKLCICNTNAFILREINKKDNDNNESYVYISWIKKKV